MDDFVKAYSMCSTFSYIHVCLSNNAKKETKLDRMRSPCGRTPAHTDLILMVIVGENITLY